MTGVTARVLKRTENGSMKKA